MKSLQICNFINATINGRKLRRQLDCQMQSLNPETCKRIIIIICSMQAAIFEPEDMQKRSSTACKKPQLQKGRPSNWSQNSLTNLAAFLLQGSFENKFFISKITEDLVMTYGQSKGSIRVKMSGLVWDASP